MTCCPRRALFQHVHRVFAALPDYRDRDNVSIGRINSKSQPTQAPTQGKLTILTAYVMEAFRFDAAALLDMADHSNILEALLDVAAYRLYQRKIIIFHS